jgi:hypothetical protein
MIKFNALITEIKIWGVFWPRASGSSTNSPTLSYIPILARASEM